MKHVLFLFLLVFSSAFGQDTPVPPDLNTPVTIDPALLRTPMTGFGQLGNPGGEFRITSPRIRTPGIVPGFGMRDPGFRVGPIDPSLSCDFIDILPSEQRGMFETLLRDCDQQASNLRFAFFYGVTRRALEDTSALCQCYEGSNGQNLWSAAYQSLAQTTAAARPQGQLLNQMSNLTEDPPASQVDVIANLSTEKQLLLDSRNGMMFQASLLSNDPADMTRLSQAFNQSWIGSRDLRKSEGEAVIERARDQIQNRYRAAFGNGSTAPALQVPQASEGLLNGSEPVNSCVSMRDYMAYRQFPKDEEFYKELRATSFEPDQWNFTSLMAQVTRQSRDEGLVDLESARTHQTLGPLIRRLDYLQRNPLVKNLFMSSDEDRTTKERLFNIIKSNLGSVNENCNSDVNGCRNQAFAKAGEYQDGLRRFFDDPGTRERLARSLNVVGHDRFVNGLEALPKKVFSSHKVVTTSDLHSIIPSISATMSAARDITPRFGASLGADQTNSPFSISTGYRPPRVGSGLFQNLDTAVAGVSPTVLGMPTAGSIQLTPEAERSIRMRNLVRVCPEVASSVRLQNSYIVNELEREWARSTDPETPAEGLTETFKGFQDEICGPHRETATSEDVDYNTFRQRQCTTPTACPPTRNLRDEYLRRYTFTRYGTPGYLSATYQRFISRVNVSNLSTSESTVATRPVNGSGTTFSGYQANVGRSISGEFTPGGNRSSVASVANPNRTPASTTDAQTPALNRNQTQSAMVDVPTVFQPVEPAPSVVTPEKKAEVQRQVDQSNTEIENISAQIAGIRETVRAQRDAGTDPSSQQLRDLNDRLANLEGNLTQERAKNASLQRQLAQMNQIDSQRQPQVADAARDNFSASSSYRPQVVTPQAQVQNLGGGNPQISGGVVPQSGGGVLGGGSAVRGPASRGGSSGVNGALLSSQRVPEGDQTGGTAITVGDSSADYLRLLSQTAGNEITESLPATVFDQLAAGDTSSIIGRYGDRMKGQYVRLELREEGSSEQVEYIFEKVGEGYRLATRNGRAIASESAPIPEVQVQRSATLQNLKDTVSTPTN